MTQQPGQPGDPNQPQGQQPYGQNPNYPQAPQGGQPPYPPHPGQPQNPYPPQGQTTAAEAKGFFGALFDVNFNSFVTIKFTKFIYILSLAFLVLGWLFLTVTAFTEEAWLGTVVLLLGWIPVFLYIIYIRILLEFLVSIVRTAENTSAMKEDFKGLREELSRR